MNAKLTNEQPILDKDAIHKDDKAAALEWLKEYNEQKERERREDLREMQ